MKPLPYPDLTRLVMFMNVSPQGSGAGASPTKFNVWRRQTAAFDLVSAYRFGGDPSLVGRTLVFNGQPHDVIGVLAPFDTTAIQPPVGAPDVWLPFRIDPNSTMQGNFFTAAGRLKPGLTVDAATAQLTAAAAEFRQAFPGALPPQVGFGVMPLQDLIVRNVRTSLWVLVGAVGFVLLIACANVANLLRARATERQREIAIRAAMGAPRGRVTRQLLTESLLLACAGGFLGLLVGSLGIRAPLALNPGNIPRVGPSGSAVGIDLQVLLFTAVVSLATGVVFGLFHALRASRVDLSSTMKESGSRAGTGLRHNRARGVLVIAEVALALVRLVGACAAHSDLRRATRRRSGVRRQPCAHDAHVLDRRPLRHGRLGG